MNSGSSFERELINNQKRIIRELKRIADALEKIARMNTDKPEEKEEAENE